VGQLAVVKLVVVAAVVAVADAVEVAAVASPM